MSKTREVVQGLQFQGIHEEITYTVDTTRYGGTPTNVSVAAYRVEQDGTTYTDVTSTLMPTGAPSVSGNVITLPTIKSVSVDVMYRIEVKFTCSGNICEPYIRILGER